MANQDQLDFLKKCYEPWSKWREENPEVIVDFDDYNFFESHRELVELVEQCYESWNEWRRKNHELIIDLSGANLSKADLRDANLSRVDLSEADLSGSVLSGVNLSEANLSNTDLSGTHLKNADLRWASLWRANLSNADLTNADLKNADLWRANLSKTIFREGSILADAKQLEVLKSGVESWNQWRKENIYALIDLREADLSGAKLTKANLCNVFFIGADLREADLTEANLNGADLREADLTRADLKGASLIRARFRGANLSDTIFREGNKVADAKQLELLKQGVEGWNKRREENKEIKIDLREVDLSGANLSGAQLWGADLSGANLTGANLTGANLSGANLFEAYLQNADLTGANLFLSRLWETHLNGAIINGANLQEAVLDGADLTDANLYGASLFKTSFFRADLTGADLTGAVLSEINLRGHNLKGVSFRGATLKKADLTETDFTEADLREVNLEGADLVNTIVHKAKISNANVYGVNVWNLKGEFKEQEGLVISRVENDINDIYITTNNIEDAQFINLILDNPEIRNVLNTLTTKAVLILGRFADDERKKVLDTLRKELRKHNLLPIVFDFDRPEDKDFTETIKTLAGLCYFVIADITSPKSSPLELQAIVPDYQIPFVPIIQEMEKPFAMMQNLQTKYSWVLDTLSYKDADQLIRALKKGIIHRAIEKHNELRAAKAETRDVIPASKFEE